MLYRIDVADSDVGGEAVVYLDAASPADATAWLHAHGFAVGAIQPGQLPPTTPAASKPPESPQTAALVAAAQQIARSPLLQRPVMSIAWGIVMALVIWAAMAFAIFFVLTILGVLSTRLIR